MTMTDDLPQAATRPKGLGRGLDALFSEYGTNAASVEPIVPGPMELPIDLIDRNHGQPRRHFAIEDLAELASSIRVRGVLQPILVRPHPTQSGRYEIVAGERRWRAAQAANLKTIPAVVRDLDDAATLEAAIIENVQRVDLNAMEEAQSYSDLIERFARTQAEVADIVGKSRSHVANTLRLLTLPDGLQRFVREGKLTAGHARTLIGAQDPESLAEVVIGEQMSVRETEKLVARSTEEEIKAGINKTRKAGTTSPEDTDSQALAADLSSKLGLQVDIKHRGEKGGELKIAYRTLAQLDLINRLLSQQID
jgi:ParB family transcriptional regulator, chromosome partitioning protein